MNTKEINSKMLFNLLDSSDRKPEIKRFVEIARGLSGRSQIELLTKVARSSLTFAFETDENSAEDGSVNCVGAAISDTELLKSFGHDARVCYIPRWPWMTSKNSIHLAVVCLDSEGVIITDPTPGSGYGYGKTSELIPFSQIKNGADGLHLFPTFNTLSRESVEKYVYPEIQVLDTGQVRAIECVWLAETAFLRGSDKLANAYISRLDLNSLPDSYKRKLMILTSRILGDKGDLVAAKLLFAKALELPSTPSDWLLYLKTFTDRQDENEIDKYKTVKSIYTRENLQAREFFESMAGSVPLGYERAYYESSAWWRLFKVDKSKAKFPRLKISGKEFDVELLNPKVFEEEGLTLGKAREDDDENCDIMPAKMGRYAGQTVRLKKVDDISDTPVKNYEEAFMALFPQWLASNIYEKEFDS